MTILTSIILIVAIVAIAAIIAYNVQKGSKSLEELRSSFYDNEEVQQVAELAKDLYNKDARPVAPKKAPKKEKVTSEDITPQVVEKAAEIAKVMPEPTTINIEAVVETVKPRKKKKFYPKAPKGKA